MDANNLEVAVERFTNGRRRLIALPPWNEAYGSVEYDTTNAETGLAYIRHLNADGWRVAGNDLRRSVYEFHRRDVIPDQPA